MSVAPPRLVPFRVEEPAGAPIPVVYDSPHSGSVYPADFAPMIDPMTLRRSEDAHMEELFAHVTRRGAPLLHAQFPRCYIDPNRNEDDLDLSMIEGGAWPGPVNPSTKTLNRGVGLIWKQMKALGDIYAAPLSAAAVRDRIERYWRPYHAALADRLDAAHARHGVVFHVNCHSMAAEGDRTTEDGPIRRPDFVIGDRDGTTCAPAFTELVVETIRSLGYSVTVNDPYKGFELVRRHGRPADGRHALQIELSRGRYMNETTLAKTAEFHETEAALERLTDAIADFAVAQT